MNRTKPPAPLWAKLFIVLGGASLVLFACIHGARAQLNVDTVTWSAPTARVDGSPLAPAEILQYRIEWGAVAGGPYDAGQATVPGSALEWVRTNRPTGRACYVAITIDTAGLESARSSEDCTEKCPLGSRVDPGGSCVALARPNAPANLSAT